MVSFYFKESAILIILYNPVIKSSKTKTTLLLQFKSECVMYHIVQMSHYIFQILIIKLCYCNFFMYNSVNCLYFTFKDNFFILLIFIPLLHIWMFYFIHQSKATILIGSSFLSSVSDFLFIIFVM